VFASEPDESRLAAARRELPLEPVSLAEGLAQCWLVYDATPVADLIDESWVWSDCAVAAPGLPPAVTAGAAEHLGDRLIHEPLALGVVTMAVRALIGAFD
jgi:pyrrolysine biosynthesis protein PylD